MINNFSFDIKHNVPTWESFKIYGIQRAFPIIYLKIKVIENRDLIYFTELKINGNYYCCGSCNFEFDEIEKEIIKDIDGKKLELILPELENYLKNELKETLLNMWISRIMNCLYE